MRPIQWLLIGGPAHGKTLSIKYGGKVAYDDALYMGENYHHDGRLYRIGDSNATPAQRDEIPALISSTGLRHIAGG